jgi:hypothetical protein
MESKEFLVDKNRILTDEYNKRQVNPARTVLYTRNSQGTLYVDSNASDINRQRLVINLVGTKYDLKSYENVLKTEFEEFVETIPDITIEETTIQDMTGQLNDYQNQIKTRDEKIDNLNATIEELNNKLNSVNTSAVAQSVDVAGAIQAALASATKSDNKKPRIFSDGTLIRDKDRFAYFYIIEDGKKRFFNFNEELLNITAKSIGKIKVVNGQTVPDLIDVSQQVIDDIPSGAPFLNFDLVKNVNTPPPPPLDLGGNRLVVDWIYPDDKGKTPDNPILIEVTDPIPANNKLVLDLQIQAATAEGIVNFLEVWDWPEGVQWFDGKMSLPIKDGYSTNDGDYKSFTNVGFISEVRPVKVILKNTYSLISPAGPGNGLAFADRYVPITLTVQNPEFDLALTPKVGNDVGDIYHAYDKKLYVKIKYIVTMPDVINKSEVDAISLITTTGIPRANITVLNGPRTSNVTLFNKISSSIPLKNTLMSLNTQITIVKYLPGNINIIPGLLASNTKVVNIVRLLKAYGFINFEVDEFRRTSFGIDHTDVYKLKTLTTNIPLSFNSSNISVPYNDMLYIGLNVHNARYSTYYNKYYSQLTDQQIIQEFNQLITTL